MAGQSCKAVIFDMDGTLIEPLLDFAQIRAELRVGPGEDILDVLGQREPEQRQADHARLLEHELRAARAARLLPGAVDVLSHVRRKRLPTALLTRNTRRAAEIVMQRFPDLVFDHIRCREDGIIKPEPDGILHCCRALGVEPAETFCVGDFEYDMVAANAAGAVSVAFLPGEQPAWGRQADYVIRSLAELQNVLSVNS
jgi:HAD superfamily hydrolase (TIGR01549 family)